VPRIGLAWLPEIKLSALGILKPGLRRKLDVASLSFFDFRPSPLCSAPWRYELALSSTSQIFSKAPAYGIRLARPADRLTLRKMRLMTPRGLVANLSVIILLIVPFMTALYIASHLSSLGHSQELDLIAFLIVGMPLTLYLALLAWVLFFQPLSYEQIWVVEEDGMLLGSAQFIQYDTYAYLDQLFIFSAHRHQGLGSNLVNYLTRKGKKPIYLLCQPGLVKYYARLGFSLITHRDLPIKLQSRFGYFGYVALRSI
jgi:GNAT superfamily N-acetyltransferase